ncbi:MAG: TonB family protein [Candidatus Eisenbacteria bacterium]|nr:TonB family protein [Candidatus Eisenbacteria bacterium]
MRSGSTSAAPPIGPPRRRYGIDLARAGGLALIAHLLLFALAPRWPGADPRAEAPSPRPEPLRIGEFAVLEPRPPASPARRPEPQVAAPANLAAPVSDATVEPAALPTPSAYDEPGPAGLPATPGGGPGSDGEAGNEEVGPPPSGPEAVHMVPATFPDAARRKKLVGTVWIVATVNARGAVIAARVENEEIPRPLQDAALTAARQWRFRPFRAGVEGQTADVRLPFRFELPKH